MLPPLFVASLNGCSNLRKNNATPLLFFRLAHRLQRFQAQYTPLPLVLILVVIIYSIATLSPLPSMFVQTLRDPIPQQTERQNIILSNIPQDARVVGSFALLPALTDRPELYSLHYAWKGTRQFSTQPFPFPSELDVAILDTKDIVALSLQTDDGSAAAGKQSAQNAQRLDQFFNNHNLHTDLILHDQVLLNAKGKQSLYLLSRPSQKNFRSLNTYVIQPPLIDIQKNSNERTQLIVSFDLAMGVKNNQSRNDFLQWIWKDMDTKTTLAETLPIAYGLYPTSLWKPEETVTSPYRLSVPERFRSSNNLQLSVQIVSITGHVGLDAIRQSKLKFDVLTPIEDPMPLTTFSPVKILTP